MPGVFNQLRCPASPDKFQRFLGTRNLSPPEEKPRLSSHHTEVFNDCIEATRTDIFQLERRIKALNSNILTVCRCIKQRQPCFTPPITVQLLGVFQETAQSVQGSVKKSPRKWQSFPMLRSKSLPNETKFQNIASLIDRPVDIPEYERVISSPTSINSEDVALMAARKAEVQLRLNLLVLKKAELEVDVENLERDLVNLGDSYEQVRVVYWQGMAKEGQRKSTYEIRRPSRPSLVSRPSLDSDSIPSEDVQPSAVGTSQTLKILRKEVPIREMIAGVRATSIFSSRSGNSRRNSWFQGDDLLLRDDRESVDIAAGSSTEFRYIVPTRQDYARGDSGVDMSADIERAYEELERVLQG